MESKKKRKIINTDSYDQNPNGCFYLKTSKGDVYSLYSDLWMKYKSNTTFHSTVFRDDHLFVDLEQDQFSLYSYMKNLLVKNPSSTINNAPSSIQNFLLNQKYQTDKEDSKFVHTLYDQLRLIYIFTRFLKETLSNNSPWLQHPILMRPTCNYETLLETILKLCVLKFEDNSSEKDDEFDFLSFEKISLFDIHHFSFWKDCKKILSENETDDPMNTKMMDHKEELKTDNSLKSNAPYLFKVPKIQICDIFSSDCFSNKAIRTESEKMGFVIGLWQIFTLILLDIKNCSLLLGSLTQGSFLPFIKLENICKKTTQYSQDEMESFLDTVLEDTAFILKWMKQNPYLPEIVWVGENLQKRQFVHYAHFSDNVVFLDWKNEQVFSDFMNQLKTFPTSSKFAKKRPNRIFFNYSCPDGLKILFQYELWSLEDGIGKKFEFVNLAGTSKKLQSTNAHEHSLQQYFEFWVSEQESNWEYLKFYDFLISNLQKEIPHSHIIHYKKFLPFLQQKFLDFQQNKHLQNISKRTLVCFENLQELEIQRLYSSKSKNQDLVFQIQLLTLLLSKDQIVKNTGIFYWRKASSSSDLTDYAILFPIDANSKNHRSIYNLTVDRIDVVDQIAVQNTKIYEIFEVLKSRAITSLEATHPILAEITHNQKLKSSTNSVSFQEIFDFIYRFDTLQLRLQFGITLCIIYDKFVFVPQHWYQDVYYPNIGKVLSRLVERDISTTTGILPIQWCGGDSFILLVYDWTCLHFDIKQGYFGATFKSWKNEKDLSKKIFESFRDSEYEDFFVTEKQHFTAAFKNNDEPPIQKYIKIHTHNENIEDTVVKALVEQISVDNEKHMFLRNFFGYKYRFTSDFTDEKGFGIGPGISQQVASFVSKWIQNNWKIEALIADEKESFNKAQSIGKFLNWVLIHDFFCPVNQTPLFWKILSFNHVDFELQDWHFLDENDCRNFFESLAIDRKDFAIRFEYDDDFMFHGVNVPLTWDNKSLWHKSKIEELKAKFPINWMEHLKYGFHSTRPDFYPGWKYIYRAFKPISKKVTAEEVINSFALLTKEHSLQLCCEKTPHMFENRVCPLSLLCKWLRCQNEENISKFLFFCTAQEHLQNPGWINVIIISEKTNNSKASLYSIPEAATCSKSLSLKIKIFESPKLETDLVVIPQTPEQNENIFFAHMYRCLENIYYYGFE